MTTRIPVSVFFALFTISGFAGLIYQSIWSHYLKLFLGHAAYAQTLVLSIFMGGMALGSWLVSASPAHPQPPPGLRRGGAKHRASPSPSTRSSTR
jgi:predicted membrane-bound spermidine synthase